MVRLGIISDTHGLLRPQALNFLRGCQHIVHGGDIGKPDVLAQLSAIAPVTAVRGNNDTGVWAEALPENATFMFQGVCIHVIHDLAQIGIDPAAAGVQVVVSGHSHQPLVQHRKGVLYVNPGSAGPRRFRLPVSVAELTVIDEQLDARIIELEISAAS